MTDTTIFTVGHSTHPIEEFIDILKAHGIKKLIDVRTVPKSRHNPQFNSDTLAASVRANGITYRRMASLGGLRHTSRDSANGAWRNASFRGYADYMQTEEFSAAIGQLLERGRNNDAAIMCAEAVPWRCHRSLIGDALLVRGAEVLDIMTEKSAKPHTLTSFARVDGHRVWYPAD
ncbi:DUF488 domain-containing protein [Arthrobacter sp. KBS0702]|uniref:DUF488 domain-containing protein n=1 Tax=Arthrobacter sp. KBS0702 TaxID=2578107 RepID=UPI00110E6C01|nr:DUF488 domain-containing protein [Arthrobacter sp. KBS0702]QDW30965.1 DUF488 domain-containing protein [Arthrobacter sp. KBS0702]